MLYITMEKTSNIIYDVGAVFNDLKFGTVAPYIETMIKYNAFIRVLGVPEQEQRIARVSCLTDFGDCSLGDISTSIQILILSKIAIKQNRRICFVAGMVGDNYLAELMDICKDTDLVSLYHPEILLPQIDCPERKILEENLRKHIKNGM